MSEEKDISAMPPEELQSAVQSILKDPAFAKLVGELSGKTPAAEEKPERVPAASVPQIPPEMLAKFPQMMSAIAPLLTGGKEGKREEGTPAGRDDAEKRKRLLAALKPYLSSSRRDAVDSILKVTEMTDLVGKMGLGGRNPQK